ncbi:hypothetical protein [Aquimarina mytili]|uniref:Uncharacterized protein n=1 Tax=Aquimarina mytili TaxID=874423 RepID=A0A937D764_9FLAO|nr:hypothetical protein [Aquimarina mytili]MBL0685179.1 hypothetical protein [Aquimarina mytili]
MKNWILVFFIAIGVMFISCQEEERELIDPNVDNTIPRNSQLASLMKSVVTHDGSFDDIVDQGHCFSIKLPYRILLNGEEVLISSSADYQRISVTDIVEIQFPVIIVESNHHENLVENITELEGFINNCIPNDDDIECIDFVYPILLSTFDSNSNRFETIEIGHDSQMFNFMSGINETTSISINYPIKLVLHNGVGVAAQHNTELLNEIIDAASICDENDG